VHARRVVPDEEWLAGRLGLVHKVAGGLDQHLVEGRHVVLRLEKRQIVHVRHVRHVRERRKRALIDDPLLAHLAPARHRRRIVGRSCVAVDHAPWPVRVVELLVDGERIPVRIGQCVEVIQIPKELVEAMHRRQVLVEVAQVILAELTGGVALRLQRRGKRHRLIRNVVRPVRSGISPVMKLARPAVQLASA